ncbi:hypothetical protein C8A00DRAFT_36662 [Chaetomidium leptoderma]|uniref:Uncharacterized protein n=1 Tax=Chaetomidium leptoderma TaxID=669021 RepID=A0AAN6VIE5_9PEZI|nr:hypothetical protein C8A00DRAFT_36662 [Chaetomidium leptoderma]
MPVNCRSAGSCSGQAFQTCRCPLLKHGTCISTLKPSCYTNHQATQEAVDFFAKTLDELWYYYNFQGSVQSGTFYPANPVSSGSTCPSTGIKYLPKSGSAATTTISTSTAAAGTTLTTTTTSVASTTSRRAAVRHSTPPPCRRGPPRRPCTYTTSNTVSLKITWQATS